MPPTPDMLQAPEVPPPSRAAPHLPVWLVDTVLAGLHQARVHGRPGRHHERFMRVVHVKAVDKGAPVVPVADRGELELTTCQAQIAPGRVVDPDPARSRVELRQVGTRG